MYGSAMRLLAPARLSRKRDESTSVDTQLEAVDHYAMAFGHELIAVVPDLSVSGAVPIRDRPGIGRWLTDDRLGDWDGVITYKLDRLFRDQADFVLFYRDYCETHGKVIISAGEGIDTSTETGKLVASILVMFAEMERGRMRVRRRDAQDKIRAALRWGGGKPVYGYEPYKDGAAWYLRPHPERAERDRWMADLVIKGCSCSSLTVQLNRKGIKAPGGGRWTEGVVLKLLRNPALRGYIIHTPPVKKGQPRPNPQIVLGDDGMPLRREPILDDGTWHRLQDALDRNGRQGPVDRGRASRLQHVAYCALCRRALHSSWHMVQGKKVRTYKCPGYRESRVGPGPLCTGRTIRAEWLEERTYQWFLAEIGDQYIWEKIYVVPDDSGTDLAETEESIKRLEALYLGGRVYKGADGAERFGALMTSLQEKRDQLAEKVSARASAPRWRKTSRKFSDEWNDRDDQGKRQLMISSGLHVYAATTPDRTRVIGFDLDENLAERAVRAASGNRPEVAPGELAGPRSWQFYDPQGNPRGNGAVEDLEAAGPG
jgi:site-specific DNA recombinase